MASLCTTAIGKEKPPPWKPVAGKADVMKHVPKKFATLVSVDPAAAKVRLHIEGEDAESEWPVLPDAEVKIYGWWGRLEQLEPHDRVWTWFAVDRDKKPRAVLMLADEMSEQDIHGTPPIIRKVEGRRMVLQVTKAKVPQRELVVQEDYAGPRSPGGKVYVQSSGDAAREAVAAEEFETLRRQQRDWLRERWRKQGLPGTVSALHPLGGEMDILLDHEAMRWGRYLKHGDRVTLRTARPVNAVVHTVRPWRERTQVRLVTKSGLDQMDLAVGQRIGVLVPEPPATVQGSDLPTDLGRLADKKERVDWFLSTIYCSCGIAGDKCTGMFYTQASCNVNACGMPRQMAGTIAGFIDAGLTDEEIFARLEKERGRDVRQPHLLR